MQVVFHYSAGRELAARLAALADRGLAVRLVGPADAQGFRAALPEAEVVWHVLTPITAAHLAEAPRLRLIQKIGVGVDTIDLGAAAAHGVAVCNLPGTNSPAVAEHAVALMLAVLRRIADFDREIRRPGGWAWPIARQGHLGEIGSRTVGLLGAGATARRLAPLLAAFGARVLYTARRDVPEMPGRRVPLPDLLAASDILSLHLPLTPETRGLIGAAEIAAMKPGAILINTARGGLVDGAALAAALASGHLGGAGLDVFPEEPVDPASPLLAAPNLVATPHVAWATLDTFARSIELMVENCRRLAAGEPLLNRVA
jgi:phosphoglycerate dehydrogenase-like enzyme